MAEDLKQRLTAILVADVAGFSRLMAADERGTVAALDAARAVFRKHTAANRGRVIDVAGDSVLAVFETATGAVSAAFAIQKELGAAATSVPEGRRMQYRIAIHLGEVMEKSEDSTIYGDDVNITARIQTKAEPGSICVSQTVYDTVKGKMPVHATFVGAEKFKNIAQPISVWDIHETTAPARRPRARRWLAAGVAAAVLLAGVGGWFWYRDAPLPSRAAVADRKSVAVLPFRNVSDDKDNSYFADGMHEELLTQLALLGDLRVVSRTSVMEYRDTQKNTRQIASELGVRTLIEGSVRRAGDAVRVSVQLVDATSDKNLWAASYDRKLADVFAIQNELAKEITRALKVSLSPLDQRRLARRPTENLAAYDLFLRHQDLVNRFKGTVRGITAVNERVMLLSKAVELDPGFALAWAKLGAEHARAYDQGMDRSASRLAQAKQAIDRALALASDDIEVRIEEGAFHQYATHDYERAADTLEKVLDVAPNNVEARLQLALLRRTEQKWPKFANNLEKVLAVDPRNVGALVAYVNFLWSFRHFDRAVTVQQQLIAMRPGDVDLQGKYHWIEHSRTGKWDAYDAWRAGLPADTARTLYRVWRLDALRAAERRDLDGLLRLFEAPPPEVQWGRNDQLFWSLRRSLVLLAKGERPRALQNARAVLAQATAGLRATPEDLELLAYCYTSHAILGDKQAALEDHRRAVQVATASKDAALADAVRSDLAGLYALLGERGPALEEIARQLKQPGSLASDYRGDILLAALWDDPKFIALVDDPANNAPLAFDLRLAK
ncbi:MAG TPA: adenylate/guanylate cyclase domain-containing protein [Burkholderiales bacterium]|nr:adenylate/guanylate cyclase domain-containing protein [Burkholderiales bacterium]